VRRFYVAAAWVTRHEAWLAGAFILSVIVRLLPEAGRPFWFDELFTFYIARLDSLSEILRAAPADGNPPLYYLLAHFCQRLFGQNEFATRLPSLLAFMVALVGVHVFVGQRCPPIAAMFAVFALGTASIRNYAVEGRPYALLLAFTVVALVSWQAAAERTGNRGWPLAGMVLGIAGAIASHHYGVIHVGIPLALGEAVRLFERRRPDFPLYAAGALGAATLALTLPLMFQTNQVLLNQVRDSPVFYGKPTVASLNSYVAMVHPWLVGLFAALLLLTWRFFPRTAPQTAGPQQRRAVPAHEIAAVLGLALLVPCMMAITSIATGYFLPRYAIGASAGIAVLLGLSAGDARTASRGGTAAALACMILFSLLSGANDARKWIGPRHVAETRARAPSVLQSAPAGRPIVVGSPLVYFTLWWESAPTIRERLHYLSDLSFAVKQADPLPELSLIANRPFVPSKVEEYDAFVSAHDEFLLYCRVDGSDNCNDGMTWVKDRLLADGYSLIEMNKQGSEVLFLATRRLNK
jgi:hypothetical protein